MDLLDSASHERDSDRHRWSIVLAGGDGTRLSAYVERRFGQPRPKQYCAFVGDRSMFEHTLDRAAAVAAPERTIVVVGAGHARWAGPQLAGRGATLVVQPANRQTAAGVFLPMAWIKKRDPDAVVAVLPSDHFVRPADRFVGHVAGGLRLVSTWRDRIVLFGIEPDQPETEYGYVVPGTPAAARELHALHRTAAFVEKPSEGVARDAIARRALWNTFVMTGHVDAFWLAGRACVPDLMARFDRLVDAIDTPAEARVLRAIYEDMPAYDFSRAVLESITGACLLAPLAGVEWSDWGRAERIEETLGRLAARRAGLASSAVASSVASAAVVSAAVASASAEASP